MTANILHQQHLDNGLELIFTDLSNRYYGDFYQIKIDIISRIHLSDAFFATCDLSEREEVKVRSRFGVVLETHQELKRMGVAGPDVASVSMEMVQNYLQTSLPYLAAAQFPSRFVRQRLVERPLLRALHE
ncbi:MAG: hypothetical protein IBX47_01190 [Desulfuromonadales bacterium]|nr:hypothetical protein [Desulfuromonadales bacterium]